jgi:hypothetical protein
MRRGQYGPIGDPSVGGEATHMAIQQIPRGLHG